ncbi:MAG TPA: hypothetical protein VJ044_09010, partial [Candidatus Hodarchaeales archaeon]|nr:hypothetical protein [Candidatus Hodarchaeales archaeon]
MSDLIGPSTGSAILLISDDPLMISKLQSLSKENSFGFIPFREILPVLHYLKYSPVTCIFLDERAFHRDPTKSVGLKILKTDHPEIPIVLITADLETQVDEDVRNYPVDAVFARDADERDIVNRILRFVVPVSKEEFIFLIGDRVEEISWKVGWDSIEEGRERTIDPSKPILWRRIFDSAVITIDGRNFDSFAKRNLSQLILGSSFIFACDLLEGKDNVGKIGRLIWEYFLRTDFGERPLAIILIHWDNRFAVPLSEVFNIL